MSRLKNHTFVLFEVLVAIFILSIAVNIYVVGYATRVMAHEKLESHFIISRLVNDYRRLNSIGQLDKLNSNHYFPLTFQADRLGLIIRMRNGDLREFSP